MPLHSMLFWNKPSNAPLDQQILSTFTALSVFSELGDAYSPRYLPAKSKSMVREVEWTLDCFSNELLKNHINKENPMLSELGYRASFFSSLEDESAIGFKVTVGNQCQQFYNVVAINFSPKAMHDATFVEKMPMLFAKCSDILKPYWGGVTNIQFYRRYGHYVENDKPSSIQWLNMWSKDIQNIIGRERIIRVLENHGIAFSEGFFIVSPTPLNLDNDETVHLCDSLNKELGLI